MEMASNELQAMPADRTASNEMVYHRKYVGEITGQHFDSPKFT
jgi:hypothetical protein